MRPRTWRRLGRRPRSWACGLTWRRTTPAPRSCTLRRGGPRRRQRRRLGARGRWRSGSQRWARARDGAWASRCTRHTPDPSTRSLLASHSHTYFLSVFHTHTHTRTLTHSHTYTHGCRCPKRCIARRWSGWRMRARMRWRETSSGAGQRSPGIASASAGQQAPQGNPCSPGHAGGSGCSSACLSLRLL